MSEPNKAVDLVLVNAIPVSLSILIRAVLTPSGGNAI